MINHKTFSQTTKLVIIEISSPVTMQQFYQTKNNGKDLNFSKCCNNAFQRWLFSKVSQIFETAPMAFPCLTKSHLRHLWLLPAGTEYIVLSYFNHTVWKTRTFVYNGFYNKNTQNHLHLNPWSCSILEEANAKTSLIVKLWSAKQRRWIYRFRA